MAATGEVFATDIQDGLQTFRVRWTGGECYALIQETLQPVDNNDVHGGLVPTGDCKWLAVCRVGSSYSACSAFDVFALVMVN